MGLRPRFIRGVEDGVIDKQSPIGDGNRLNFFMQTSPNVIDKQSPIGDGN